MLYPVVTVSPTGFLVILENADSGGVILRVFQRVHGGGTCISIIMILTGVVSIRSPVFLFVACGVRN